jgi:hypothetical protein
MASLIELFCQGPDTILAPLCLLRLLPAISCSSLNSVGCSEVADSSPVACPKPARNSICSLSTGPELHAFWGFVRATLLARRGLPAGCGPVTGGLSAVVFSVVLVVAGGSSVSLRSSCLACCRCGIQDLGSTRSLSLE